MNRSEIFSGGFRALLSAGSMGHIATWVKKDETRTVSISLNYATGEPLWQLILTEAEQRIFADSAPTLDTLLSKAVVALGRF